MAPKPKVADLEAKLKAREEELQAAQAALTKAVASRTKLKQYIDAFREQAVNTTQVIAQFQQLQQDYNELQGKYQELEQETERLRQQSETATLAAAAQSAALQHAAAAEEARSESAIHQLKQQLHKEQKRGQGLQERCSCLEEEQQAASREVERLRQERERLLQEQHQRQQQQQGTQQTIQELQSQLQRLDADLRAQRDAAVRREKQHQQQQQQQQQQQDSKEAIQGLIWQLQREQRQTEELRAQLDSISRLKQQEPQQHTGASPKLFGSVATHGAADVAPSTQKLGRAAATTAVVTTVAAVAPAVVTEATVANAAGVAPHTATEGSRQRRGGDVAPSAPESVAGSAVATSESESDSDSGIGFGIVGDGDGDGDADSEGRQRGAQTKSGNRSGRVSPDQHGSRHRGQETREKQRGRGTRLPQEALAALEAARRELEALRRREAAQRADMEQLQSQLQTLQALISEHAAVLKWQSAQLQRQDGDLQRHNTQLSYHGAELERHGTELRRQGNELAVAGETAKVQTTELERLREARDADAAAIGGLAARLQGTEGRVEVVAAQLHGINRTHRLLRQAFGSARGGSDGEGDAYGLHGAGAFEEPSMPPRIDKPLPSPVAAAAAAPRPMLPPAAGRTAEPHWVPPIEPSAGDGTVTWGGEDQAGLHRDKRRRLEGQGLETSPGHKGSAVVQPGADSGAKDRLLLQTKQQRQEERQALKSAQMHVVAATAGAAGAAHGGNVAAIAAQQPVASCPAHGDYRQRPAVAAATRDASAREEATLQRRGRGRPRKERTPGELLATLLDGKSTGAGQMSKVAAAAARRAATAVRSQMLQPTSLADAICGAVLRCCRFRVSVPSVINSDTDAIAGTALKAETAVDGVGLNGAGRVRKAGGAAGSGGTGCNGRTRGPAAVAAAITAGGFLSMLMPSSSRSRVHVGPGTVAAASAARVGGGLTLLDALTCLWCKPPEQQRQVVRWLLQMVRDTDRLLVEDAAAHCGGGGGGGGRSIAATVGAPTVAVPRDGASKLSLKSAADMSTLHRNNGIVGEAEAETTPALMDEGGVAHQPQTAGQVADGPLHAPAEAPDREPDSALLGSLLAQQLSAVACSSLDGSGGDVPPVEEATTRSDVGGLRGSRGVHDGDETSGRGMLDAEAAVAADGVAAGGTGIDPGLTLPAGLAERCAAAQALGQLFHLYRDREGYQSIALELLHSAAEARSSTAATVPLCAATKTAVMRGSHGSQPPAGQFGISLVPLCCLLVGWPQALLPAVPPSFESVNAPPQPQSRWVGANVGAVTPMPLRGASCKLAAGGGSGVRRDPLGGLHRDGPGDLFSDQEVEEPEQSSLSGSKLDQYVWAYPAWEAQLLSEPLATAMTTCTQLLALERLAECCGVGSVDVGSGADAEAGAGAVCGGANGIPGSLLDSSIRTPLPLTATNTAVKSLSYGSAPCCGNPESVTGVDCQAEAVAVASLLRAVWEQQQQQEQSLKTPECEPCRSLGSVLPGVAEVLLATGAVKATVALTETAGAQVVAVKGGPPAAKTDEAARLQQAAQMHVAGGIKSGGREGDAGDSVGGLEELDAVLVSALDRARSALSELAARLVGLLLVVLRERQLRGPGRLRVNHQQPQQQQPQQQQQQSFADVTVRAKGPLPAAAVSLARYEGSLEQPQLPSLGPQSPQLSGHADVAYISNLRQALLLTCHMLPHNQVYDRVLRQLVWWLQPGGPVAISGETGGSGLVSANISLRRKHLNQQEASLAAWQVAPGGASTGATAEGAAELAASAAADTAASAAGSPVMASGREDTTGDGPQGAPLAHPLDGAAVTVELAAGALVAPRHDPAGPVSRHLEPENVRMLVELIRDIACQALSQHGAGRHVQRRHPFLAPSPTPSSAPSPSPNSPSPGSNYGASAPVCSLSLHLACSSLCESLVNLLPALLDREERGSEGLAPWQAGEEEEEDCMQDRQERRASRAATASGNDAAGSPRRRCVEVQQATVAMAAALVSAIVQVSAMCVAGLDTKPSEAVDVASGGHTGPSSLTCMQSAAVVGQEVKTRVGRALRALQEGLRGATVADGEAMAAVVTAAGLPVLATIAEAGRTGAGARGP